MRQIKLIIATLFLISPFAANAVPIYYQEGFTPNLYTFDTNTSASMLIGSMGPGFDSMGMSFDGAGTLYGYNRGSQSLYTINTSTAATTLVGMSGLTSAESLSFDLNGNLFAMDGFNLYSLNTANGAASLLGNIGTSIDGLSVNPLTGQMYGIDSGRLYTIDTIGISSTLIGNVSADETIAFAPDGTLYGHNAGSFYSIDLNTLTSSLVGNTEARLVFASAIRPTTVPEPGTLVLLGLGLVGMGLTRRRKKI